MKPILLLVSASLLFVTHSARSQIAVEFNLEVVESSGVTVENEAIGDGEAVNEENYEEVEFGEDAFLIVRNKESGIKYRIETAADLEFLGNALAKSTGGSTLTRWVVGGSVKSMTGSTLSSLSNDNVEGFSEEPAARLGIELEQVDPATDSATPSSP